ncbi:hypothetical protein ANANG_G00201710 [Anguilla anguilla]|uniref:Uncharacterized protein n=1 Tax=Anguilla anguilla TaxID=7936 RepID=A0A9D3LY18_ANGAN|nr:hypothetical protein ANANG_G00201710 [Anguilla anguilla]
MHIHSQVYLQCAVCVCAMYIHTAVCVSVCVCNVHPHSRVCGCVMYIHTQALMCVCVCVCTYGWRDMPSKWDKFLYRTRNRKVPETHPGAGRPGTPLA